MKIARPGPLLLLATLTLTTALPAGLLAQEATGIRGTLSVTQGLEWSDNRRLDIVSPGSTLTSVTRLGFGAISETRTQQLNFNVDGSIEGSFGDGATDQEDFRIVSDSIRLGYSRSGANSRLSFDASTTTREIDDDVIGFFVNGEFDPNALVLDGGEVERTRLSARIETGLEGPFGLDVSARSSTRDYVDTTDPELVDQETVSLDATARFRIRPSLALRARAGMSETDETELGVVQTTSRRYLGFGVEAESAGGLAFTGDLILDKSQTDQDGVEVSDDDGVGFEVTLEQARPNGSVGFEVTSRVDNSGRRSSARVLRSIDMPTGALSFSLGLVDQENADIEFTSSLAYARETPAGRVTANLQQSPSTDAGEAFLNTSFSLGLTRELSQISELGASIEYGSARAFTEDDADRRATFGVTYQRELTRDWDLTAGLEHTRVDDADDEDRSSNTVFINIGRDFDFGF
ncbi:hypothetical protein GQ651_01015 [Alphaproteobacteria bacterium GH1-50]|uniref:Beta-barrel porin 2 n=1 Tax=Kangsaoukella pontilimi TaxID=2691042 RepID=A0A7C9MPF4_9RHOB|nr:hypothetical protein [Kangsaoukella pontilimi]MXQ06417.1 hypothetical protein [Kangsaoukella pontilimi]